MNADMLDETTQDDEDARAFADLVERELHGEATDEEIAWLWSDDVIEAWKRALIDLRVEVKAEQAQIRAEILETYRVSCDMGPAGIPSWRAYRDDMDARRRACVVDIDRIDARMGHIMPAIKDLKRRRFNAPQTEKTRGLHAPSALNERYRKGYCDAWEHAIYAMRQLMLVERMSRETALQRCEEHLSGALHDWYASDCDSDIIKPWMSEACCPYPKAWARRREYEKALAPS